jgi:hypothetical protein
VYRGTGTDPTEIAGGLSRPRPLPPGDAHRDPLPYDSALMWVFFSFWISGTIISLLFLEGGCSC